MDMGLKGRVAMIAAASKGIGKSCALRLAQEGCKVSICSRTSQVLMETGKELESLTETIVLVTDVSSPRGLENWYQATVEAFGQVDILVTNTGGPPVSRFLQ